MILYLEPLMRCDDVPHAHSFVVALILEAVELDCWTSPGLWSRSARCVHDSRASPAIQNLDAARNSGICDTKDWGETSASRSAGRGTGRLRLLLVIARCQGGGGKETSRSVVLCGEPLFRSSAPRCVSGVHLGVVAGRSKHGRVLGE